jgi:stage II sporulation protein R
MWGLILLALLLIAISIQVAEHYFKSQEAFTPDNLIRLHVIANSNSTVDQNVKLEIKDQLVNWLSPRLATSGSANESRTVLAANLKEIQNFVSRQLQSRNQNYGVKVMLGEFDFPTRRYGDLVLPEGKYQALRVILGEGQGRNWWCVLYPPLCVKGVSTSIAKPEWYIASKWKKAWRKETSLPEPKNNLH